MRLYTTIEIEEQDTEILIDFNIYDGQVEINSIEDFENNYYPAEIIDTVINEHVYDKCFEMAADMKFENVY